ncbi:DUF4185 domain-containing protein [Corynebacterium parakroppenstedtii]|uniref:DUF4185 domain-containing protein n=1 Tax=Corynebacterium parakroppenstedtii TaxID=2828363 RepID=UPI001C8DCE49|nr:DUF4185 domain-containing protein [Corynebacterium parakroppenstedtii]MBY0797885.1 DUF4185 domain-containing protein [Corynebacterium parakroppenstedtii]
MSRYIHTSAGNGGLFGGHPTDRWHVKGTDLGFFFEGGKQFDHEGRSSLWVGGLFGDTVNTLLPTSGVEWRSPVMGRTSNTDFLDKGVTWDNFAGGEVAKQIFPYNHVGNTGRLGSGNADAFTVIPNDAVQLPNGYYMAMGFRVRDWDTGGEQFMCHTISNCWFWSDEPHAENWQLARHAGDLNRVYEWANSGRDALFQNATFLMVPGDENVYVFGTREGRHLRSEIFLRRCHWTRLTDDSAWEFWGFTGGRWQWGHDVQPTPILKGVGVGSAIGEINAQYIAGKVVLTYNDGALGSVAVVADRPDSVWSSPTILVSLVQSSMQYAPSVHPWNSNLEDSYFHLSSWLHGPNLLAGGRVDHVNYCTQGWRGSLVSQNILEPRSLKSRFLGLSTDNMSRDEADKLRQSIADASAEANPALRGR